MSAILDVAATRAPRGRRDVQGNISDLPSREDASDPNAPDPRVKRRPELHARTVRREPNRGFDVGSWRTEGRPRSAIVPALSSRDLTPTSWGLYRDPSVVMGDSSFCVTKGEIQEK